MTNMILCSRLLSVIVLATSTIVLASCSTPDRVTKTTTVEQTTTKPAPPITSSTTTTTTQQTQP